MKNTDLLDGLYIRYAMAQDIDACQEFNKQMGCPDNLEDKTARQEIIIATHASRIVGYMRMEMVWNNLPFISWLFIKEEHRGQGVGTTLLHFIEQKLRASPKKPAWLLSSSEATNTRSIAWHKKRDFIPCGQWEGTHPGGINELFFKKPL